MNDFFEKALVFTLWWETGGKEDGAFHDDPKDPGGETKWGISKKAYPDLDIKNITAHGAHEIYRRDYWIASKCHHMPDAFSKCMFDTAVNVGVRRASRMVQRVVKVEVDGKVGTKTLAALSDYNKRSENHLINKFLGQRIEYYTAITLRDPKLRVFYTGWVRRTIDLAISVSKS
jgi:lysozyme family protein